MYYDEYINKFSPDDKALLKEYFDKLNKQISLTKRETKLVNEDFSKAIDYLHNKGKSVKEIVNILNPEGLGLCYKEKPTLWYPLDNSAKIYPLSMKENWMSVYRTSYYLKENIVPSILNIALLFTMKRFPTFRTSIRKGFFWHYIDGIKKRFYTYEDRKIPCSYINVSNVGKLSFKIVYYENRISIECFHILTDGYGSIVFLTTLVSTYLRLLGNKIGYNDLSLNIDDLPTEEECKDEFVNKKKVTKGKGLIESKALDIDGRLSVVRPCQILHFDVKLNEIKDLSKKYDVTLTELILGFIFISLQISTSGKGDIKVQIPVNMRKYYPSKSIRNFSLYATISINREKIDTLENVLIEIKRQMQEKVNIESMNEIMTYARRLVDSLRLVPLFIKRPIANLIYGYLGDKSSTTVLSNLGKIDLPKGMEREVLKADFSLGTAISNRVLFSMISCNNTLTLTLTKFTTNKSVENSMYNLFQENNIQVYIHGSEVYENRK